MSINISELVSMTVATGIPPIELTYRTVRDCDSYLPIAYRTEVSINSVELGNLMQRKFAPVSDKAEVGIRLCEWAINKALTHREAFLSTRSEIKWISVACPVAYAELPDFYQRLKALLEKHRYDAKQGVQLCLEFTDQLLLSQKDVRTAVLDLKVLGVKSLLVLNSADTCAFFKLVDVPLDMVLLTDRMTQMVDNRNKPEVFGSIVNFLRSVDVAVVADGAKNNDQLRAFNRADFVGYFASDERNLMPEEAMNQKEGEVQ